MSQHLGGLDNVDTKVHSPVWISQTRSVWSFDSEKMCWPFGASNVLDEICMAFERLKQFRVFSNTPNFECHVLEEETIRL